MRLLPFRIGEGDLGPRLAQPKAQLPEQALALTHAQRDAVLLSDPDRQRFAIPQIAAQPGLPRRLAKSRADLFQLLLIQAPGPPSSLSLAQTYQALLLATANPILHRPRRVAQQPGHLGAGHSLGYQQHTVEAVVVAGILGASDLILQSEDDAVRVGYAQWSHALRRTHPVYYTQVLMTLCLTSVLVPSREPAYAADTNSQSRKDAFILPGDSIIPQVATGGGNWFMTFQFVNLTLNSASVTLSFFDSSGNPMSLPYIQDGSETNSATLGDTVAPGGIEFATTVVDAEDAKIGYARVQSTPEGAVAVSAAFNPGFPL